jgi:3-hydroxybutyryl-CoA dehydrogenase
MVKKIGVVGAGQMGNGIAHVCAQAGYKVILSDISVEQLDNAVKTITKNLDRMIKKEKITEDVKETTLKNISTATDLAKMSDVDLVIEAASENENIKGKIFADLAKVLKPEAIIGTNTSSISITKLAAMSDRPEKFVGVHFMNPVPMMKLLELIKGIATSKETYETVAEVAVKIGKTVVTAEDIPGFIVNRILIPMINEAANTLYEGIGNVVDIDNAMMLGANQPIGPLALADLIGIDVCVAILNTLNEGLNGTHYKPSPLLVKYAEAGWLGRKTKRGFYDYSGAEPVPTR